MCQKISGTPGGSYYAYKRRYPGQFVEFDGITYCSEEFGRLLLLNKGVRTYREELHAVQPVLPLNFGESLFLLNASERDINSESGRRNIEQLGRK
ncbi:MAG: hypothetical protein LBC68_07060 [Prevotellaceae bacterium]|nr:hypothetical protein [Prevotellaceae bacterium]